MKDGLGILPCIANGAAFSLLPANYRGVGALKWQTVANLSSAQLLLTVPLCFDPRQRPAWNLKLPD